MADLFQEDDDEDKTCLLCSNAYSGEIHQHLLSDCLAPCSLGCEDITLAEFSVLHHLSATKHMSIHLTGLANKISKLRDEKKQSADAISISWNSMASFSKSQGITEQYIRTSNILNKIVGSIGGPLRCLFRSTLATDKHWSKLNEMFLVTSTDLQKVVQRGVTTFPTMNRVLPLEFELKFLTSSHLNTIPVQSTLDSLTSNSFNGKYLWKVAGIGELFVGRINSVYSSPFLTAHFGYNMYCKLYINGVGDATGISISIFTCLAEGPVDELLQWPFNKLVKISIINQKSRTLDHTRFFKPDLSLNCFAEPSENGDRGAGAISFAPSMIIYSRYQHYVVDDIMYISIEVADSFDDIDENRIQLAVEEPMSDVSSFLSSSPSDFSSSSVEDIPYESD